MFVLNVEDFEVWEGVDPVIERAVSDFRAGEYDSRDRDILNPVFG